MKHFTNFVGVDMGDATFAAGIYRPAADEVETCDGLANQLDGFDAFVDWLDMHEISCKQTLICIENTGVYSEGLCYYLHQHNYAVWLESPDKVKHAFKIRGHKTDPADAAQIAEYAFRYTDRLRQWQPKCDIIEQLRTLLGARELLIKQRTANSNALKAFQRKACSSPLVIETLSSNLETFSHQINELEKQMMALIQADSDYLHLFHTLDSVPGIALLGAANLLVVTEGGKILTEYPKLAAYIGIAPLKHQSGSSIKRKDKSSGLGPKRLRKLLSLAAKSLVHNSNNKHFKTYYQRKLAQGKTPQLIYNNIANKLLRIACALIRKHVTYQKDYISMNPAL